MPSTNANNRPIYFLISSVTCNLKTKATRINAAYLSTDWPLDYLPLIFLHCEVGQPGHFPFASWISQVSSAPHVPSGQGSAHRTTGHSGARSRPPRNLLAATRLSKSAKYERQRMWTILTMAIGFYLQRTRWCLLKCTAFICGCSKRGGLVA